MAGMIGVGGGVIVVPALLFIFNHYQVIPPELGMHLAAGTSFAIMFFTSQASIWAHRRLGTVAWPIFKRLIWGIALGTIVGGFLSNFIATFWLKRLLALFLIFIGMKMAFGIGNYKRRSFPAPLMNQLVSLIIGLKSGLLGIGGGALIVPYLKYCGVEVRQVIALSASCTLTVATIGAITFALTGYHEVDLPRFSSGYIYWVAVFWVALPSTLMAPLGVRLAYFLPMRLIEYCFIILVFITALNLLL